MDAHVHRAGSGEDSSLVTIDLIARSLGTDFASLATDKPGSEPVAVHAPGEGSRRLVSALGSRATLQVATSGQPAAELWDWILAPGDRYDALPDAAGSGGVVPCAEGHALEVGVRRGGG